MLKLNQKSKQGAVLGALGFFIFSFAFTVYGVAWDAVSLLNAFLIMFVLSTPPGAAMGVVVVEAITGTRSYFQRQAQAKTQQTQLQPQPAKSL